MRLNISITIIFILGLTLLSCQSKSGNAQETLEDTTQTVSNNINFQIDGYQHLTFIGIPIDGTKETFEEKLKAKGFYFKSEYSSVLRGRFANTYADVRVISEPRNNIVYAVEVKIDEYSDTKEDFWNRFSKKYDGNYFKARNDNGDYIIVFPRYGDTPINIEDLETFGSSISLESRGNNELVITYEDWWNSNYNHQALENMDL